MRWVVMLLLCTSCQGGDRCKAWAGSTGGSLFFQCGDGRERTVRCDTKTPAQCKCAVDGITEKTFESQELERLDTRAGAITFANANCGWTMTK